MESTLQIPALAAAKNTPKARTIVYWIVRLKEWAYAGFAINLASALIAHLSMGDGAQALAPSAATSVLWGLSYGFWRGLQAEAVLSPDRVEQIYCSLGRPHAGRL